MRMFVSIVLLAIVVLLGAAVLVHFNLLDRLTAVLLATMVFLGLIFQIRQSKLSQELTALKVQSIGLVDFEQDIDRRLTAIEQQLSKTEPKSDDTSLERTERVVEQLGVLEQRLNERHVADEEEQDPPAVRFTTSGGFSPVSDDHDDAELRLPRVPLTTFENLSDLGHRNIEAALAGDGLSMHLQPIVELPTRKPLHYEAFMRLQAKQGQFLDAKQFLSLAESGGLMPVIDKKVIFSAIRMLRTLEVLKKRAGLFCNMSRDTLADTKTFNEVLGFLDANATLSSSLVFEVSQRHFNAMNDTERERLSKIVDLGYELSLVQANNIYLDFSELNKMGFSFLKVPAYVLLEHDASDAASANIERMVVGISEENFNLIVTEVELEGDVIKLIDLGIMAAQGSAFARPRAIKANLLEHPHESPTAPLLSISKPVLTDTAEEAVDA